MNLINKIFGDENVPKTVIDIPKDPVLLSIGSWSSDQGHNRNETNRSIPDIFSNEFKKDILNRRIQMQREMTKRCGYRYIINIDEFNNLIVPLIFNSVGQSNYPIKSERWRKPYSLPVDNPIGETNLKILSLSFKDNNDNPIPAYILSCEITEIKINYMKGIQISPLNPAAGWSTFYPELATNVKRPNDNETSIDISHLTTNGNVSNKKSGNLIEDFDSHIKEAKEIVGKVLDEKIGKKDDEKKKVENVPMIAVTKQPTPKTQSIKTSFKSRTSSLYTTPTDTNSYAINRNHLWSIYIAGTYYGYIEKELIHSESDEYSYIHYNLHSIIIIETIRASQDAANIWDQLRRMYDDISNMENNSWCFKIKKTLRHEIFKYVKANIQTISLPKYTLQMKRFDEKQWTFNSNQERYNVEVIANITYREFPSNHSIGTELQ